jgi:DNA-binding response OmpR family regulator
VTQQINIYAMAILPSHEDRLRLSEIFRHSRWHLDLSECLTDARALLDRTHLGVVLTDSRLPDGGWKDVMHELGRRHITPPPVIVVSRLADERLWAEVLNLCGYDVLATPFHTREVLWSISSAWRHWRDNCVSRASGSRVGATQSHSAAAGQESANGELDPFRIRD